MPTKQNALGFFLTSAILMMSLVRVRANWDEATGYVHDYTISSSWLAKNKPKVCSDMIQVSECSHNTRLHFPDVQLMAIFTVNHKDDAYHGCPYGICCAFAAFPNITDLVPNPADTHISIWHKLGGFPGVGTSAIANPETGLFGYEEGQHGEYIDGPPNKATYQPDHDKNYPGFHLPEPWPPMTIPTQPNTQPPCCQAGKPSTDPNPSGKAGGGPPKDPPICAK